MIAQPVMDGEFVEGGIHPDASAPRRRIKFSGETPQDIFSEVIERFHLGTDAKIREREHFAAFLESLLKTNKFVIPVISETSPYDVIDFLYAASKDTKVLGNGKIGYEKGQVEISGSAINFNGKNFKQDIAFDMALEAMFNQDMLEQGVVLTGSPKEQVLLMHAINEVNRHLPEGSKLQVNNPVPVPSKTAAIGLNGYMARMGVGIDDMNRRPTEQPAPGAAEEAERETLRARFIGYADSSAADPSNGEASGKTEPVEKIAMGPRLPMLTYTP